MAGTRITLTFLQLCVFLSSFLNVFAYTTPESPTTRNVILTSGSADGNLTFVQNSGLCETVEGVGQSSGYINLGGNNSLWFWFFESRNSPDTDPFVLWLNGGPGCSSMIGLFTETGPCTVNSDKKTTSFNPYSWNNYSNILYLDQPFGAGYSTGVSIDNSTQAATYAWSAFQVLFSSDQFSQYKDRQFVLATESYGARFGPVFINYFNAQNQLIDSGKLDGVKVVVSSLMISDGKHDPMIQFSSLIDFVQDAPGYGQLATNEVISEITDAFNNVCQGLMQDCYDLDPSAKNAASVCNNAIVNCTKTVYEPAVGNRDADYLLLNDSSKGHIPSTAYASYIRLSDVQDAIGVSILSNAAFDQCDSSLKARFSQSGETGRTFLPELAVLAEAKFPILIWAGDADMKANWLGVHQSMVEMSWYGNQTLNNTELTNMTINGEAVAQYKVVDNFTFARVFGAGHTLPSYQPEVAQVIFSQFISNQTIHSVSGDNYTTPSASASGTGSSPTSSPNAAARSTRVGDGVGAVWFSVMLAVVFSGFGVWW